MDAFDHDRLDVYRLAIDFNGVTASITGQLPPGNGWLKDQLARAALSIPTNTAEGAGEFSRRDKARFYRIALRSATECAAILDVCRRIRVGDEADVRRGRELLLRVVSMLTKLALAHQGPVRTPARSGT